jgi:ATP-dependent RNA helicase RhlE
MPFSTLGLTDRLVQGVRAAGFTTPTDIQSRAIPPALLGKDLIGLAHTGTGKTAAFMLPMLQRLSERKNGHQRAVRGLVLTPTRELAKQIEDSTLQLGGNHSLSTLSVYGGVSMENQLKRLRRGVDIVIATPGRLLDHISQRTIDLSHVEILVLDEADRMFDMGFIEDVRKIVNRTPNTRQTMLFSATMPESIRQLTASIQREPEMIQVGTASRPATSITQAFYTVPQEHKLELLMHVIEREKMDSVLVFSRTKHGAEKITKRLSRREFTATSIHSNRSQAQRQQALAGFKQGRFRILVATDIAARGIDVEGITHVINYDTPMAPEDYIHRIGRTGRAALTGDAITFVSPAERKYAHRIEQLLGKRLEVKPYAGFVFTPVEGATKSGTKDTKPSFTPHRRNEVGKRREGASSGSSNRNRPRVKPGHNGKPGRSPSGNSNGDGNHGMHYYERKSSQRKTRTTGSNRFSSNAAHQTRTSPNVQRSSAHVTKNDWMTLLEAGEKMKKKVKRGLRSFFAPDPA